MPHAFRKRCKATGKIRWRTRLDALIALAETGKRGRDEVRAYLCPDCGSWHLTARKVWRP